MNTVALVVSLKLPLSAASSGIDGLSSDVTWVQVRADLVGDISVAWLRQHFKGKLLYSLRSSASGGRFEGTEAERKQRIISACRHYDLVELESDVDLNTGLLEGIPAARRLISWYGPAMSVPRLRVIFDQIAVPAHSYCIVTTAGTPSESLQPLLLMNALRRQDLTAFSEGPHGLWTRVLSPYLGAPFLFGQLDDLERSSGDLSIHQLVTDYGFPSLYPVRQLFGMVGNKIFHSPSPRLHNGSYKDLNHPALFLPFHVESFQEFWRDVVESSAFDDLGFSLDGFVVVSPHKEAALAAAGRHSEMVKKAGAANVMVRRNGVWEAHTTDPESIAQVPRCGNLKAAVIGCGGAGRAVAAALHQAGAKVILVNRGRERGLYASRLLGMPFTSLSEFCSDGYDLLVNATPLGKEDDRLPFKLDSLNRNALVVDLAYGTKPTRLVSAVRERGGMAIDGYDVLLTQVRKQFFLLSGQKMPNAISREVVLSNGDRRWPHDSQSQTQVLHTLEAS
jgi:3-dehydroquinate dehydratase/shikimate dehydrogenase